MQAGPALMRARLTLKYPPLPSPPPRTSAGAENLQHAANMQPHHSCTLFLLSHPPLFLTLSLPPLSPPSLFYKYYRKSCRVTLTDFLGWEFRGFRGKKETESFLVRSALSCCRFGDLWTLIYGTICFFNRGCP